MTLLEVLAGLLVLGTLLASVTIARARFIRQWSDADRKITAIKSADAQIAQWLSGPPANVPLNSEGTLDAPANCGWRTRLIPDNSAATLGAAVVRMQIIDRGRTDKLLAQVDFLLPARVQVVPEAR